MGEIKRTTKLAMALGRREQGGANNGKRANLDSTAKILNEARSFYIGFLLAHPEKLSEKVTYFSKKHQATRERVISANELLTWMEYATVRTKAHATPKVGWDFSARFVGMPMVYRRSVIKDAIGKARSYLANLHNFTASGKKRGKPGLPGADNHPTLYKGSLSLRLNDGSYREAFVRLKVYDGKKWVWQNYPLQISRWHDLRLREPGWHQESPKLVLKQKRAELHIPQARKIEAKKVIDRKKDKDLVTIAVDLNVKNLAVITVRQHGKIIQTRFVKDHGLDRHRYHHLKRVSKHQWLSGKPVRGEHSNISLWRHVRRTNEQFAQQAAKAIAEICSQYPDSILILENLRNMHANGQGKSHRLNRKLANQLRGMIRDYAKYKAFSYATVTVEVNPHGTSQYCSQCGAKGERFSYRGSKRMVYKGGKLFHCPDCGYEANADFNASVNHHHSFFHEYHWQPRKKATHNALSGYRPGGISRLEGHPAESLPCPYANEHTR